MDQLKKKKTIILPYNTTGRQIEMVINMDNILEDNTYFS